MTEQSVLLQEKEKQKRYDASAQLLEAPAPRGVTLWELRVLLVPCTYSTVQYQTVAVTL